MKIKIKVTEEDIKNGHRMNSVACPVANALNRTLPGYKHLVNSDGALIWLGEGSLVTKLITELKFPIKTGRAILNFDKGFGMKPFTFELDDKKIL